MSKTNMSKGVALAFLTAVISGFSIFYSKISLVTIDPLLLTTLRNLIVGFLFVGLFIATRKLNEIARLTKKDLMKLLAIGIGGGAIPFYLFFTGLKLIGAQQGNMIHKTLFVWVGILAFVFLKEKINTKLILAGILVIAGTYLITPFRVVFGQGAILILIADLFWAAETIVAKKVLAHVSSELTGLCRMLIGGSVLAVTVLASGKSGAIFSLGLHQWGTIAVGSVLLFFYVYTWFKALSHAPAGVVTLVLTWSLVVGNVLSGALTHTRLAVADWYSMALLSGGLVLAVISVDIFKKRCLSNEKVNNE